MKNATGHLCGPGTVLHNEYFKINKAAFTQQLRVCILGSDCLSSGTGSSISGYVIFNNEYLSFIICKMTVIVLLTVIYFLIRLNKIICKALNTVLGAQ